MQWIDELAKSKLNPLNTWEQMLPVMEEIRICPTHGFYRGKKCECGHVGKLSIDKNRVDRLGRFISGILRHFPQKFNLEIDENGWAELDILVEKASSRYKWVDKQSVEAIVTSDKKNRYEISNGKIRARYGHSINVVLSDYPIANETKLYYGTSDEEAQRLLEIGIKPVNQTFVHLSTTIQKSERVARLRTDNPVIIEINAEGARKAGIMFLKANEFIVLSKEIPPEFIKKL